MAASREVGLWPISIVWVGGGLDNMANICEPMINLVTQTWLKMLISHNQNGTVVKLSPSKLEPHGSNTTGEQSEPNLSCQQHETW
jgi:hypothetical protein